MKTLADQYDFTRPSLSGKYGFETFEDEQKKLFYFHFNDKNGKALLFSQGYHSARSRDGGLEAVVKNAEMEDRYDRQKTKEGKPYFVLKAGNHQEIARSIAFDSMKEMEAALVLVKTMTPGTPVTEGPKKPEGMMPEEAGVEQTFEKSSRYKFSVIYYPESRVWKLTHDLSGKSKQFKELDGPALVAYIEQFLPAEAKKASPPAVRPAQWKEQITAIELVGEKHKWEGKVVRASVPLRAEFTVPVGGKPADHWHYDARVFARSLENASNTFIGEVEADLQPSKKISVPLHLEALKPGIYRIVAKVDLGEEGRKKEMLEGSRLVQVV